MSEKSVFWSTTGTGDGPLAGYTAADMYNFLRRVFLTDQEASQGVLRGVLNELAVTGSASPLSVASGAAICYGMFYSNSSPLSLAVGTPVNGTTGGRVNLQVDWTAQIIRAVVQVNTDGTPDIPALVQVAGDKWSVPLATFTITTGGAIALNSAREYCQFAEYLTADMIDSLTGLSVIGRASGSSGAAAAITAASDGQVLRRAAGSLAFGQVETAGIADDAVTNDKIADLAVDAAQIAAGAITNSKLADNSVDDAKVGDRVPALIRRIGNSATDWNLGGVTTYTPAAVRIQTGAVDISIGSGTYTGSVSVTFPVAFSGKPMVFLTVMSTSGTNSYSLRSSSISASAVTIAAMGGGGGAETLTVSWMAIGPE